MAPKLNDKLEPEELAEIYTGRVSLALCAHCLPLLHGTPVVYDERTDNAL